MKPTPWPRLVLLAGGVTVLSAVVLRVLDSRGWPLFAPPIAASLVIALLAGVVARLGWNVRMFTRGKRPGLDPLMAARTVVLASAAAYTGALLGGWYAGHALAVIGDLAIAARREIAISAAIALAASVLLSVVGLVAERWCQAPPPGDDDPRGGVSAGSPA